MTREASEPYVRAIARTMARSKYPLAWFENYPTEIFRLVKQIRNNHEEPIQTQTETRS
jgi:hypothetical protein